MRRLRQRARHGAVILSLAIFCMATGIGAAIAAPYAAMVVDARSGKVLHSRNADTQLHPASLTKMMTLYVVFDAVRRGEIGLDDRVLVSRNAASEPPSKLYLKAGQRIKLRYLIRASAVKSANDAATAMAEAVSGSEAAFTRRMTQTARALGMSKTTFKNAHGLTESGHLSTARDMTTMGRALFYHFPEYYNLFSRNSTNAGGKTVYNTNRRLLAAYNGADGIKTGYTRAAGFNLVASARRGDKRVIATVFGGSSGAARNARVAELLDLGFKRAPRRVAVNAPRRPNLSYAAIAAVDHGKTLLAVARSTRPAPRPGAAPTTVAAAAVQDDVDAVLHEVATAQAASTASPPASATAVALLDVTPQPKPAGLPAAAASEAPTETVDVAATGQTATAVLAEAAADDVSTAPVTKLAATASPPPPPRPVVTYSTKNSPEIAATAPPRPTPKPVVVARTSPAGGATGWGINVGTYASRYEAERILLKTALIEIETLDEALRKVERGRSGFDANFVGLDRRTAMLACERLAAREQNCQTIGGP